MDLQDEEKTLQAFVKKNKGDTSQLGTPEKMAIMLATLPMVRDWLGAMLFREEFVVREREISEKLQLALTCAAAVRASGKKKEKKKKLQAAPDLCGCRASLRYKEYKWSLFLVHVM